MSISFATVITGSASCPSGTHLYGRDNDALRAMAVFAILAVLIGCKVSPEPLTDEEQQAIIADDRLNMFVEQEPIEGPITLAGALDRALKYNLDNRLMVMEQALRSDQLEISRFDMWPRVLLNSGYNTRSNDNLSLSRDTQTDALTTNPFLSQDRSLTTQNLGLTWNILDFGVSYYQAKQSADLILIAQQRRRSVMNQIIQQVRSAYWRAATAEPLYEQVIPILTQARQSLADARQAESLRLVSPIESLQFQKGLVEIIRELDALELDLAIAKSELAALMGLPPSAEFTMALPEQDEMLLPELEWTIEEMEDMALGNRPELIEERYQRRISSFETKRALLNLFPSLTFNTGGKYDSNSYLLEQGWAEAGLTLSSNLLNLANGRSAMRAARTSEEVGTLRRLAMSMAALTQIHISYQQFMRAGRSYSQALVLDDIERRIFENVNISANNQGQSPLQRIRAQLSAVYAEVNRYRAYSEVQNALANLYVSTGIDLEQANQYPGLVRNDADGIDSEAVSLPQIADSSELESIPQIVDSSALVSLPEIADSSELESLPRTVDSSELVSLPRAADSTELVSATLPDAVPVQVVEEQAIQVSSNADTEVVAVTPNSVDIIAVQVANENSSQPSILDLINLPRVATAASSVSIFPAPEGQDDAVELQRSPIQSQQETPDPVMIAGESAETLSHDAQDDRPAFTALDLFSLTTRRSESATLGQGGLTAPKSAAGSYTRENGFTLDSMYQAASRAAEIAASDISYTDIERDSEFTVLHLFMLGSSQVVDSRVN